MAYAACSLNRIKLDQPQFAASPPVNNGEVAVREGMPGLTASLELGPSLDIKLWHSPTCTDIQLRLFLPARLSR